MQDRLEAATRKTVSNTVTIVVPVFNEERHVDSLARNLTRILDGLELAWSVLFVDDGSHDETLSRIRALSIGDGRFGALALSRNFGKEAAIAAGLKYAPGDAVILMDADFQHPPETIPSFIEAWRAGSLVVFGRRQGRVGEGALRRWFAHLFYRLFRLMSDTPMQDGITDFILLDRKAVDALNSLGERSRFTKGLYAWIGFRSTTVSFPVGERKEEVSRFNFFKLGRFALDGLASFSSLPLKVWSYLGLAISAVAIIYAIAFLLRTLISGIDVPGFPSLIVSIMFLSGVQLISLGVIGEYIARVYSEVKARPLFLVAEEIGRVHAALPAPAPTPESAPVGKGNG